MKHGLITQRHTKLSDRGMTPSRVLYLYPAGWSRHQFQFNALKQLLSHIPSTVMVKYTQRWRWVLTGRQTEQEIQKPGCCVPNRREVVDKIIFIRYPVILVCLQLK